MEIRESWQPRFAIAFGAVVVATAAFAACIAGQAGGERVVLWVSDGGQALAAAIAAVSCVRAGLRHARRLRIFWWLLAAACTSWTFGQIVFTGYDLAGGDGPPVPSWADVGFLPFIPLAVAALLYHPGLRGRGTRHARLVLDGLGIGIALLFLSWTAVLGPLWRNSDVTALGDVVTLAYPVGDVVIGFFAVLAVRRMTTVERLELWCLLVGLLALAVADSVYAYVVHVQGYATGNLLDTGWFAGFLAIALGARASNACALAARVEAGPPTLPALVAPLLPLVVALGAAGLGLNLGYRPDRAAVAMAFALVLLAFARQGLLVVDFLAAGRAAGSTDAAERLAWAALGAGALDPHAVPEEEHA